MIELDFLASADGTPLTKTFERSPLGGYDVTPYPFNRNFNSIRVGIDTVEDLYAALVAHASVGNCLLKGNLVRQLENESRQGTTNPSAPTRLIVLDLDFQEGWETIDEFLAELDPSLIGTSYVFQHSASAGIKYEPGLRGHVYLMTERPILPAALKSWLKARNLQVERLRSQLGLASNGASLKWPLDITTCQSDKLIYIAPPQCIGFEDPLMGRRFELCARGRDFTRLHTLQTMVPATLERDTKAALAEVRSAQGLEPLRPRMREITRNGETIEYLTNPDNAVVTGVKSARGWTYLNLNGGDSWAYYFPDDNPEFLHNFKGEPIVRLKDIAPDFYREYRARSRRTEREARDFTPIVFRDRARDTYYNVLHHDDGRVEAARASSMEKLRHFMMQYNEPPPEVIHDWEVVFDPTCLELIDPERRWLNQFQPTPFMLNASRTSNVGPPPIIAKIVDSICGNDKDCAEHFYNWLAYKFQTRKKCGTAWIFHGVHGTGKGVLFSKVLKPLFGAPHVLEITGQLLEDQFNGPLETALLMGIDEFHHESARSSGLVMNKMKNIITEPFIAVRAMRQEAVMVPNFVDLILMTNHPDPVALASTDRRFNIPPAQETPLRMRQEEITAIADELAIFADFLMSRTVTEQQVRTILHTEARARMIVASQTSVERFFESLRTGDLGFFTQFVFAQSPMAQTIIYHEFDGAVKKWVDDCAKEKESLITMPMIRTAYEYVIGTGTSPSKLLRMFKLHRVDWKHGLRVRWAIEENDLAAYNEQREESLSAAAASNVVPLSGRRHQDQIEPITDAIQ